MISKRMQSQIIFMNYFIVMIIAVLVLLGMNMIYNFCESDMIFILAI